jgi:hypothetical protein
MTKSINEALDFASFKPETTVIGSAGLTPQPVTPEDSLVNVKQYPNMMDCSLPAFTSPYEQSPLPLPPSTDFLRGYSSMMSLSYGGGGHDDPMPIVVIPPVAAFPEQEEDSFDMEVEGITPPPPFTTLESGVLSSWSHFGEVSDMRGSPQGVADMTAIEPTMPKPMNSLFSVDIQEADAFMSADHHFDHVFSGGTKVKRALF